MLVFTFMAKCAIIKGKHLVLDLNYHQLKLSGKDFYA